VYDDGPSAWAGEIHIATATLDDSCIPRLEAHMKSTGRPRYLHVFFSDRGACLGDLAEWASAPRFGGTSGTEPLPE
jgi:hypothetical protein